MAFSPFRDIWELYCHREPFWALAERDLRVRWRGTIGAVFWAFSRPVFMTAVLSLVFGEYLKLQENREIPYALLVLAGWIPWQLFQSTVTEIASSYEFSRSVLRRVSLPNLVVPISATVVNWPDALAGCILLLGGLLWYQKTLSLAVLMLVFPLLTAWLLGIGAGLFLGSLSQRFKDFRFLLPFLMQALFYLSPVGYSHHSVSPSYQAFLAFNPLSGILSWMRSLIFSGLEETPSLFPVLGVVLGIYLIGALFHHWLRPGILDEL